MIYYLIYISIAKRLYTKTDLSQILTKSRINNQTKSVTGTLLYHEGSIIQILEGNSETIKSLYLKIQQDKRHHNIIKMADGTSDHRNFPDLPMGFRIVSDIEWKEYAGYLALNPSSIIPMIQNNYGKIYKLLKPLVNTNSKL